MVQGQVIWRAVVCQSGYHSLEINHNLSSRFHARHQIFSQAFCCLFFCLCFLNYNLFDFCMERHQLPFLLVSKKCSSLTWHICNELKSFFRVSIICHIAHICKLAQINFFKSLNATSLSFHILYLNKNYSIILN